MTDNTTMTAVSVTQKGQPVQRVVSRTRRNLRQFLKFGLVGGSGVLVNQIFLVIATKASRGWFGISRDAVVLSLGFGGYNVRWYHVIAALSFVVANTWNFFLNRVWTFKSNQHESVMREYFRFLFTGVISLALGLVVITVLMGDSMMSLPSSFFDDSSGLRNKFYWANIISILVVTPVNFVINKVWTFQSVRQSQREG